MTIPKLSLVVLLAGTMFAACTPGAHAASRYLAPPSRPYYAPPIARRSTEDTYRAEPIAAPFDGVVSSSSRAVVQIKGYRAGGASLPMPTQMMIPMRGMIVRSAASVAGAGTLAVSGSGFFVTADGYVVTNDHVIADRSMTYTVTTGGEELPATIMYADPTHDVAILKVDGTDHPHLTFGDSDRLAVGDTVVHIGNALGRYVDSASTGIVTALGKSIVAGGGTPVAHYFRYGRGWQLPARAVGVSSGGEHLSDLVELRANIYAGDSGGPVLDANGDVVAVTVAAASGVPTGYAIPANEVKAILAAHGVTI